jgi:hypothetical protein
MRRVPLITAIAVLAAGPAAVVAAAPPSLTMTASPTLVAYGGTATLSGTLSNKRAGQTVSVEAQECGQTAFKRIATVTTTTNGAWTYVAKPTINSTYRAKFKSATSSPALVRVRPAIRLKKRSARHFSVALTAAQSFQGKFVYFQRYVASSRKWRNVTRVTLKTATGTAPAIVTSSAFRVRITARLKIRALLPQTQAGTCYVAAQSNVIRS